MQRLVRFSIVAAIVLFAAPGAYALGFRNLSVSVGLDLTQTEALSAPATISGVGADFDSARLVFGSSFNGGEILAANLDLVPGLDVVFQDDLKIYSINLGLRYRFFQWEGGNAYVGASAGAHLVRPEIVTPLFGNQTRGSLNIPVGFQRSLAAGLGWFGELKVIISDSQNDSSFRFNLGLVLGRI